MKCEDTQASNYKINTLRHFSRSPLSRLFAASSTSSTLLGCHSYRIHDQRIARSQHRLTRWSLVGFFAERMFKNPLCIYCILYTHCSFPHSLQVAPAQRPLQLKVLSELSLSLSLVWHQHLTRSGLKLCCYRHRDKVWSISFE